MRPLTNQLRTLALLLRQQVPLSVAVERLARHQPEWAPCSQALAAGSPWPQALAAVSTLPPEVLPFLGSDLDSGLAQATQTTAELLDARDWQHRRWTNLLIYPSLLVALATAVLIFVSLLFQYYLVQVSGYSDGSSLIYRWVFFVTGWVTTLSPALICLPVVAAVALRSPTLRSRVIPIASNELRARQWVAFLSWLSLSLKSQPTFPEAIRVATGAVVVPPMRKQLLELADSLERGSSLETQLPSLTLWSPLARWLWLRCEQQGQSQQSLDLACQCLTETILFQKRLLEISIQIGFILYAGGITLAVLLVTLSPMMATIGSM